MRIKLRWIKRGTHCSVCGGELPQGSKAVSVWFRFGKFHFPKTLCKPCFQKYMDAWWARNPWQKPRRKTRIKSKSSFPSDRRKLLSLLIYHRKRGNTDRVVELEAKIKQLEQI